MIIGQEFCGKLFDHIRLSCAKIDDLKGCVGVLGTLDWAQQDLNAYIDTLKDQMDYLKDRADEFKDVLDTLKN